ncbi:hypothetical protein NtB2_00548 [Lactococcus termiticola]|uniref:Uncharacterized protein n=2 Tax=Lactococcus termiticola TaxID=2169526 RepID=A0A2R5HF29_9LACT|nr:hypothetical protein NtB2_00548 [Lactococcus termiticola]
MDRESEAFLIKKAAREILEDCSKLERERDFFITAFQILAEGSYIYHFESSSRGRENIQELLELIKILDNKAPV